LSPFWVQFHSGLSLFGQSPILGSVVLGSVILGSVVLGSVGESFKEMHRAAVEERKEPPARGLQLTLDLIVRFR
jgi:hypothetical protein